MYSFWKFITQKARLTPIVDRLIRYTYVVVLTQAASLTLSSCESAESLMAPIGPTAGSVVNPVSQSASRALNVVGAIVATQAGDGSLVTSFTVNVVDHPGVKPKDDPTIEMNASQNRGSNFQAFLRGPLGDIPLTRDPDATKSYGATHDDYVPGTYTLSVVGADGELVKVNVTAPDIHTITSPSTGDNVMANKPLKVRWDRDTAADGVVIETLDFTDKYKNADNGQFTITNQNNPPRDDQIIRVTRINRQVVTKGKTKSEVVAEFSTFVDGITVE